jgi:hypothetical protein
MRTQTLLALLIAGALALGVTWTRGPVKSQPSPDGTTPTETTDDNQATLDSPGTAVRVSAPDNTIVVPRVYRLPGIDYVPTASTYEAMMATLSDDERIVVETLYATFGAGYDAGGMLPPTNIFSFKNKEQLHWFVESGFPSPVEILHALRMGEGELRDLAESGNFKAAALYHASISKESANLFESVAREDARAFVAHRAMEDRILGSGSSFAPYVIAMRSHEQGNHEYALAAYQLAGLMGDRRYMIYSQHYSRINKDANAANALIAFQDLWRRAARGNPRLYDLRNHAQQPTFPN